MLPLTPLPPSPTLVSGCARGEALVSTPVPVGGGVCALPPAHGREFQRVCAWQLPVETPGSSPLAPLVAQEGTSPQAGSCPNALLSPQVVPESGARQRERDIAQQTGQVRPLLTAALMFLAWDPLGSQECQLRS